VTTWQKKKYSGVFILEGNGSVVGHVCGDDARGLGHLAAANVQLTHLTQAAEEGEEGEEGG